MLRLWTFERLRDIYTGAWCRSGIIWHGLGVARLVGDTIRILVYVEKHGMAECRGNSLPNIAARGAHLRKIDRAVMVFLVELGIIKRLAVGRDAGNSERVAVFVDCRGDGFEVVLPERFWNKEPLAKGR